MPRLRLVVALVVALAFAGCGAHPTAVPATERPAPLRTVAKPAAVSCADAAVILRGRVDDERSAGPMREEAIAKACLHDAWSREVIDCVGRDPRPRACLDQLAPIQRARYHERLAEWHDEFPAEALRDEAPADGDDDAVAYVACADAIGDVSRYAPVLALKGSDRELATAMRRGHILALCDDWTTEDRTCFEQAKAAPGALAACRKRLAPDQEQELVDRLAEVDAVMAKVAALATRPGTIACPNVVAAHYADARWVGKLGTLAPAAQRKLIAASRSAMAKACAGEKWSTSLRACVVARGGDACFTASGITPATWGFPASAIPIKTGIVACDAYGDTLRALAACTAIPRQAAQTMLDSYQQAAAAYLSLGPPERAAAARSCAQADSAIRESATSLGCTI